MTQKVIIILAVILLISVGVLLSGRYKFKGEKPRNTEIACTQDAKICPDGSAVGRVPPNCEFAPCPGQDQSGAIKIIAQNLEIPWGLVFLPDRSILFTERPGRVRMIGKDGNLLPTPLSTISEVKHIGEGGLLGIALHPNFSTNNYVYLYYTYSDNGVNYNRVERYQYSVIKLGVACPPNNPNCNTPTPHLSKDKVVVDKIPSSPNHNGGRIKFGPDNFLYITTGDAQNPSQAQDKNSLAGKILRVTDDGKKAPDNPFNNLVYSYGHRNPQGLAWDNYGRLWETEHGSTAFDEVNVIHKGENFGWPEIRGNDGREGMQKPFAHSGNATWAPSGVAALNNKLYFAGLRGQAIYSFDISPKVTLEIGERKVVEHFKGEFGRIRDVVLGPDNFLYITTSNRDGRGTSRAGDDKIIKIDPQKIGR